MMPSVVCCFNFSLTQPKRGSWGKTGLSKGRSPKKSTMQKVGWSLPKCLQGRKQFQRDNTSPAQHFPTLISFSFLAVTKLGDSVVCVTGLATWGFEKVGALLPQALSGEQWNCSEHQHHQSFSLPPALSANSTTTLLHWDGKGFKRHGESYWQYSYPP